jgi:hypothetical protein
MGSFIWKTSDPALTDEKNKGNARHEPDKASTDQFSHQCALINWFLRPTNHLSGIPRDAMETTFSGRRPSGIWRAFPVMPSHFFCPAGGAGENQLAHWLIGSFEPIGWANSIRDKPYNPLMFNF